MDCPHSVNMDVFVLDKHVTARIHAVLRHIVTAFNRALQMLDLI